MADFGMIGLGTMGRNLVLNIAEHGYSVCGYDRDEKQRTRMLEEAVGFPVTTAPSSQELIESLKTPRVIMLLVPAGKIVDIVLEELIPNLSKGDIVIDGGNSHFTDTERRYQSLQHSGIHFIGMGVSGGEEGARKGPSMMPGGNLESYNPIKDILTKVAAKAADGAPCVAYMGHTAAGHYVKMVHNGIEYAMMQLIAEVYALLKKSGYTNTQLHALFTEWNQTTLQSFLIEITAAIFTKKDELTSNDLVDMILDKAKQKGTGLWTSESALALNVPIPTIDAAVSMRYLSSLKDERITLATLYNHEGVTTNIDSDRIKDICYHSLVFGFTIAYTQGLNLLQAASKAYNYEVDIKTVIKVWRAGCIIRSALLADLYKAYNEDPSLTNVLASKHFVSLFSAQRNHTIECLKMAMGQKTPMACIASALNYFDAYTSAQLPANLIQAQRDFFGAHTYERIDQPGIFHTQWED